LFDDAVAEVYAPRHRSKAPALSTKVQSLSVKYRGLRRGRARLTEPVDAAILPPNQGETE
jgi:hypothetical protein